MKRALFAMLAFASLCAPALRAQSADDLRVFGYFQTQFRHASESAQVNLPGGVTVPVYIPENVNSFSLQHLNVLFAKNLSERFSAFVNLEFINTYDSDRKWGSFGVQEAWVRYRHDRRFDVKVGALVPTFNNLNTIKNRAPLLPYIIRPFVYENSYASVLAIAEFVPQQAFVELSGSVPAGDATFDYAAYMGNSEAENVISASLLTVPSATDTSSAKLFGGRVGARWNGVKVGVSAAIDRDNLNRAPYAMGEVDRLRLGADASFALSRFFGEGEYIRVSYNPNDTQQARLDALPAATQGMVPGKLGRTFYYALLGVDLTDALFAYGTYDLQKDEATSLTGAVEGFDLYSGGAGYRINDALTVKAQYIHVHTRSERGLDFGGNYVFGALSATF